MPLVLNANEMSIGVKFGGPQCEQSEHRGKVPVTATKKT